MIDLQARLFTALRGLYLLSNGATAKIDANRVNGSKERPLFPAGDGRPVHEEYARRWAGARTERDRVDCVEDAERELASWRRQSEPQDREFERGSLAWKRRIANEKRGTAEVARLYSVSRHQVAGFRSRYREDEAA